MYYTFEFWFYNPVEHLRDGTSFCAKDAKEAVELFEMFCKENGFDATDTDYTCEVVYDQGDAEWYGEEYCRPEDVESGKFTGQLMKVRQKCIY